MQEKTQRSYFLYYWLGPLLQQTDNAHLCLYGGKDQLGCLLFGLLVLLIADLLLFLSDLLS